MTIAVVAEKPSVARDIASVLGAGQRGDGVACTGAATWVTWAIGHLVALAQPHEIDPAWKRWSLDTLPMLPAAWPLVVTARHQGSVRGGEEDPRLRARSSASSPPPTRAEGEAHLPLRVRGGRLHQAGRAACGSPSLTPDAIKQGFSRTCGTGASTDPLADAARGRSRADWLVGMNLSRAQQPRVRRPGPSPGSAEAGADAHARHDRRAAKTRSEFRARGLPPRSSPPSSLKAATRLRDEGPDLADRDQGRQDREELPPPPDGKGPDGGAHRMRSVARGRKPPSRPSTATREALPPPALYDPHRACSGTPTASSA